MCLLVRLARGNHDQAADPLRPALAHNLGHALSRHRQQCQIDWAGHVGHDAIRPQTCDGVALPIDRIDDTGELPGKEIADDVVARRARFAARLDDGDRRGPENVIDRAHCCGPFTLLDSLDVLRLSRELQRHPDYARVEKSMLVKPRRTEDAHHPVVVGEDIGHEPPDLACDRRRGEMLEQHRAKPPPLVVVPHDERDLGLAGSALNGPPGRAGCATAEDVPGCRGAAVVAGHCHKFPVNEGDERQPVSIVNRYEVRDLLIADSPSAARRNGSTPSLSTTSARTSEAPGHHRTEWHAVEPCGRRREARHIRARRDSSRS